MRKATWGFVKEGLVLKTGLLQELEADQSAKCYHLSSTLCMSPLRKPCPLYTACHPRRELSFEHTVELRGIVYDNSLQRETSDYYRMLTPTLERLVSWNLPSVTRTAKGRNIQPEMHVSACHLQCSAVAPVTVPQRAGMLWPHTQP